MLAGHSGLNILAIHTLIQAAHRIALPEAAGMCCLAFVHCCLMLIVWQLHLQTSATDLLLLTGLGMAVAMQVSSAKTITEGNMPHSLELLAGVAVPDTPG